MTSPPATGRADAAGFERTLKAYRGVADPPIVHHSTMILRMRREPCRPWSATWIQH